MNKTLLTLIFFISLYTYFLFQPSLFKSLTINDYKVIEAGDEPPEVVHHYLQTQKELNEK
ncbi:MAG: hypothetical protein QF441_15270 [Bacteriovoracaceae bacterium]|jgi:hypothetical protein|nr:hypothetical protein [Bacteriovoracaceae bacterium]